MLIRTTVGVPYSEITDEKQYLGRREFIRAAGLASIGMAVGAGVAG